MGLCVKDPNGVESRSFRKHYHVKISTGMPQDTIKHREPTIITDISHVIHEQRIAKQRLTIDLDIPQISFLLKQFSPPLLQL